MQWLERPVVSDDAVVGAPLDPARLSDTDLRETCFRMLVILATIEMPRCAGRWIPVNLFEAIDTLESMVLYGHPGPSGCSSPPRLAEWTDVIHNFGRYYELEGSGPIMVDPVFYYETVARYSGARKSKPGAPSD